MYFSCVFPVWVVLIHDTSLSSPTVALHGARRHDPGVAKAFTHRTDRLLGLVVKAAASRAGDPGFESRLRRDFFGVESYTSDFKIGTPVATLPGAWRYRVSAGTGWPGVSIL